MRHIEVSVDCVNAWEVWDVQVPDDAPTDPDELKKWLETNLGDCDRQMSESGADEYNITDVLEQ